MIIGRSIGQAFPPRPASAPRRRPEVCRLGARDLSAGRKLRNASFDLHKGEILGVAGLQGMGQLDLFLAAFGMREIAEGHTPKWMGARCRSTRPSMRISPTIAHQPAAGGPQDRGAVHQAQPASTMPRSR